MKKKEYNHKKEENQELKEPFVAYDMGLDKLREAIGEEIKDIQTKEFLEEILIRTRELKNFNKENVSYTLEKLHKHLDQAEKDYKAGRYYTTEELFQMHPEWNID